MRIQHNILAMNAYRNYNNNTSALAKNLEKLSSGYKINRAGDDAAGLAISEKMRAQITGLNAAQKNVKDGISLVKTAEGAMQEIQDMLNRMDYLATQSANGTYDNEVDRAALQKEVDQLKSEINRIADSANFNGIKLLNGDWAPDEAQKALDSIEPSLSVDGTKPTAAGKASSIVKLGPANAGVTPSAATEVAAETFEGVTPNAATKATFSFKTASAAEITGGATATSIFGVDVDGTSKLKDLGDATVTVGGQTVAVKDIFDVEIGGNPADLTDAATAIAQGSTVKMTLKSGGELSSTEYTDLKDAITNAVGGLSASNGTDEGTASTAVEASYSFKLDLNLLAGGQKIELAGKTIKVETNAGTTGNDVLNVAGLDNAGKATALNTVLTAQFGTDFDIKVGTPDATTGKVDVSLTAKGGKGLAGNQGDIHFINNPTGLVSDYNYTKYQAATAGDVGKHAQVAYQSDLLKTGGAGLKAGAVIDIGGTQIKIVSDSATPGNNEIKESAVGTDLVKTIEKLTNNSGLVQYDATNGKLTFTAKDLGTGKLTDLKTATKVQVSAAPTAPVVVGGGSGYGGQDITLGTTTVDDLKNKEVTLTTGETVKLGDVFNISASKNGSAVGDSVALGGEEEIKFEAKKGGKLDANLMKAINYSTNANSTVTEGWDEGKAGGANKTKYELTIDTSKVAGGQSITFGTDPSKSITFDLSMDADPVNNGTVTNPDPDTEVGNNRYTIKLGGQTTAADIAEKIRSEIGTKMGDFNVTLEATADSNSFKLKLEANTATEDTNLGNVRFSSQAGAFSGADYKAYFPSGSGKAGTYAQVAYDFDMSKLESGDALTIGGKTVYIGDADKTELNEDGTAVAKVTVKKDGLDASKLVKAFEMAGYKGGQIKIGDGKLTITDSEDVGGTASALKAGKGAVSLSITGRAAGDDKALTLQIGDTSENFNQLKINIGSMKTTALGIADLKINTPDTASAAISTIKAAINQVSSVRGDLGAYQNRLEHTANNLSVMAENIQDAESTIRDTDVAEEMMAYTKNNILVQSAQAMLAQANAVPQGVLQLLG